MVRRIILRQKFWKVVIPHSVMFGRWESLCSSCCAVNLHLEASKTRTSSKMYYTVSLVSRVRCGNKYLMMPKTWSASYFNAQLMLGSHLRKLLSTHLSRKNVTFKTISWSWTLRCSRTWNSIWLKLSWGRQPWPISLQGYLSHKSKTWEQLSQSLIRMVTGSWRIRSWKRVSNQCLQSIFPLTISRKLCQSSTPTTMVLLTTRNSSLHACTLKTIRKSSR